LKRWDFWFGLIGVLGVAFAIYSFVATNKIGRLSYAYDTQKVFDPSILSGFTLVASDKTPVDKIVYATDLAIWNSGDLSLSGNSDRVREPFSVKFSGTIFYHITAATNLVPEDNYQMEVSADRTALTVRWKYFDPGQGLRLTIIHGDNGKSDVAVGGRFFETRLTKESASRNPLIGSKFIVWSGIGAIIFGLLSMILFRLRGPQMDSGFKLAGISLASVSLRKVSMIASWVLVAEGLIILGLWAYITYLLPLPPI
jgi:hypothetical protein